MKRIFFPIILVFVYGCASIRDYGENVFLNLQLVSNRIVNVILFEEEDTVFVKQLEEHEEQLNIECSALQKMRYRRVMGEPVGDDLKYEVATNLQSCNEVVIQTDQFLKENNR